MFPAKINVKKYRQGTLHNFNLAFFKSLPSEKLFLCRKKPERTKQSITGKQEQT